MVKHFHSWSQRAVTDVLFNVMSWGIQEVRVWELVRFSNYNCLIKHIIIIKKKKEEGAKSSLCFTWGQKLWEQKLQELLKWVLGGECVFERQRGTVCLVIKKSVFLWTFLKVWTSLKGGQRKGQKITKDWARFHYEGCFREVKKRTVYWDFLGLAKSSLHAAESKPVWQRTWENAL